MTNQNIARLRLRNQRISRSALERPADVVSRPGAVQAQDYLGSLWAVGLRMRKAVESDIEQALAKLDPKYTKQANSGNGIFYPTIVVDGRGVGTWKRTINKDALVITPSSFAKLKRAETRAFAEAASRYGEFLGASVVLPQSI